MACSHPGTGPIGLVLCACIQAERPHWVKAARVEVCDKEYVGRRVAEALAARMLEHYEQDLGEPDNPFRRFLLASLRQFPFIDWAESFIDEACSIEERERQHPTVDPRHDV